MDFKNKTVWITGASSGIGEAVARKLAHDCSTLILSGRNVKALTKLSKELEKLGAKIKIVTFSLEYELEIARAFKEVMDMNVALDALLQFGGISHRSLANETEHDVERRIFEINYFGTVMLAKMALQHMLDNGGGLLAATSSIVGKFGFPYRSSYSASKHALHGYFETIRAENVSNNIRVSMIIPGRVTTNISKNALLKNGKSHDVMDEGIEKGMDVNKAAEVIVKQLSKEKKEILVGGKELLMVHIRRWFPALLYKLASKVKPT